MKTENLKNLGLNDEQIKEVMALKGKVFATIEKERDDLKAANEKVVGDLSALQGEKSAWETAKVALEQELTDAKSASKAEPEDDWKHKYEALKKDFDEKSTTFESERAAHSEQIKNFKVSAAIEKALSGKAVDTEVVMKLLDTSNIGFDEKGKLTGLDEQIKDLQENKAFLFRSEEGNKTNGKPPVTGIIPADGIDDSENDAFIQGFMKGN